jgi:signal transduction histidine kinase
LVEDHLAAQAERVADRRGHDDQVEAAAQQRPDDALVVAVEDQEHGHRDREVAEQYDRDELARERGPAAQGERFVHGLVDLAAYRIVQESLTNAHKYGTGRVALDVVYTPNAVTIDVGNAIGHGAEATGSGYGLVGMRERAAAAGGTVTAGPVDGRFAVHAELPATAKETP